MGSKEEDTRCVFILTCPDCAPVEMRVSMASSKASTQALVQAVGIAFLKYAANIIIIIIIIIIEYDASIYHGSFTNLTPITH